VKYLALLVLLTGCGCGFMPTRIIVHPDAPVLITQVKGKWIRIAVYDGTEIQMIDAGWIPLDDKLIGWSIVKYDWEKFIRQKREAHGR